MKHRQLENTVLWAGCRSDEYSYDAEISGKYHGAFTYYFLAQYFAALSRLAISENTTVAITKEFDQHPQLECTTAKKNAVMFK